VEDDELVEESKMFEVDNVDDDAEEVNADLEEAGS